MRAKVVKEIYISISVKARTSAHILQLCPELEILHLRTTCYHQSNTRHIVEALTGLQSLKEMSFDPVALFRTRVVCLPETAVFQRLTHIHLSNDQVWRSIPLGLERLTSLTHLSITCATYRPSIPSLTKLLAREDFKLLVLWRRKSDSKESALMSISMHGLSSQRVVLLSHKDFRTYLSNGGFWYRAERIVEWRKKNNSKLAFLFVDKHRLLTEICSYEHG